MSDRALPRVDAVVAVYPPVVAVAGWIVVLAVLVAMPPAIERWPVTALLLKSAAQFQTTDPAAILKGAGNAGTRAFLAANKESLLPQVVVIVQRAGEELKLRETYSKVMLKGGGLLGSFFVRSDRSA